MNKKKKEKKKNKKKKKTKKKECFVGRQVHFLRGKRCELVVGQNKPNMAAAEGALED